MPPASPEALACERPGTPPDAASTPAPAPAPLAPGFWQAFFYWLRLGFLSFGGPAGQIAMMHDALVLQRRWISERRFLHALNYCMVLPGPEAQQLATYIGWLMHGTWGGIAAGGLFVLPSLLILIGLSWVYMALGKLALVAGFLYGVKPAVTALVLFSAWRIGHKTLRTGGLRALALLALLGIAVLDLPFPLIVLLAGCLGYLGQRYWPAQVSVAAGGAQHLQRQAAAVIDDDTPTPPHARFRWRHLLRVLLLGLGLWALAIGGLAYCYGSEGLLTQMAWFFTKAALLTFGGAYAVLPYVYQGAVEQFHWLSAAQMMDGLALGETTPGPLIMVLSFLGFVAGWSHAVAPSSQWLGGVVASCWVTFFTFLPSFVFIFLGGPLIETSHGNLRLAAPLTGITAAVVGVIVNLALFFAYHVFWPGGWGTAFDGAALAIGVLCVVALGYYKVAVIRVVLGAGCAGMLWQYLHSWS